MIQTHVGDHGNWGFQDVALADQLIAGLSRHAFCDQPTDIAINPLTQEAELLTNVSWPCAANRVLSGVGRDYACVGTGGFGDGGNVGGAHHSAQHAGDRGFATDSIDMDVYSKAIEPRVVVFFALVEKRSEANHSYQRQQKEEKGAVAKLGQ